MKKVDLRSIQRALRNFGIDGWLFCDFRSRDPFAYRILGISPHPLASRRWYYFIPARGVPVKVMSRVEPERISTLPGATLYYTTWKELSIALQRALGGHRRCIAMQYSPCNALPYVSTVDAGTVELIRNLGHKVVSSKDLITLTLGRITPAGHRLLTLAAAAVDLIRADAFRAIGSALACGKPLTEYAVQQRIMRRFKTAGLTTYSAPMVGVGAHPANPHFETSATKSARIQRNQPVLIDLWAKVDSPAGIYFDSTWVGYTGRTPPRRFERAFIAARDAREAALEFVTRRMEQGVACRGFEVDRIARRVVAAAGFERYFIHRTGHSITTETHGEGVNIDDFETHDDRLILPQSCFSIEPGIYIPKAFGVRTEITVAVDSRGHVRALGELQRELVLLDC
jgi:Xaa-Pro dipeptidase